MLMAMKKGWYWGMEIIFGHSFKEQNLPFLALECYSGNKVTTRTKI
jgi:hypothetical protein